MANGRNHLRNVFKVNRKTFFNPSAWIDYVALADLNRTILDVIRTAFLLPRPAAEAQQETFEQAMERQGLTEADIKTARQNYRRAAMAFCLLGAADLIYSLYLLFFHFAILGFMLGAATTALFFGQAFRFDFWAFQISERRLGISVSEWWRHITGKKGRIHD